jgi:hypothetical protein
MPANDAVQIGRGAALDGLCQSRALIFVQH